MSTKCVLALFLVARFAVSVAVSVVVGLLSVGPYSKAETAVEEEQGMGAWKSSVPAWL